MSRLPSLTGKQVVEALQKAGFTVIRQRGSQVWEEKRAALWATRLASIHRFAPTRPALDLLFHQSDVRSREAWNEND